jgi:hypothetical protein
MLPMLALIQSAPGSISLADDVAPRIAWSLRQFSSRQLFSPTRPVLDMIETTETYYSDAIRLEAGHIIFTDIARTPLAMPSGSYVITSFFGDIVDAITHEPSPLDALYGKWTSPPMRKAGRADPQHPPSDLLSMTRCTVSNTEHASRRAGPRRPLAALACRLSIPLLVVLLQTPIVWSRSP